MKLIKFSRVGLLLLSVLLLLSGTILALNPWAGTSSDSLPQPVTKLSHTAMSREQDVLVGLLQSEGVGAAFGHLRQRIKAVPAVARECHPLLHHIGKQAYTHYGSFAAALEQSDELCNSGYVHGVVEANFVAATSMEAAISGSCGSEASVAGKFAQWQCYHGVGHGVMYATAKNLPESLDLCKTIANTSNRQACINGVYMENFIVVDHAGASIADSSDGNADTDIAICARQASSDKADCYAYAPTAYLERHPDRYVSALQWCRQAESGQVNNCIAGVGAQAMKDNITKPAQSAAVCNRLEGTEADYCTHGAVGLYINHHAATAVAQPLCIDEFKTHETACLAAIRYKQEVFNL